MRGKTANQVEELREKVTVYEATAQALEDLRDEVREADSIGETRLSKLFHEARTSRKRTWKSATAFIDIEDGEAVVDSVSKIRDGRWTPETLAAHDTTITVPVRPFMDTQMFRRAVADRINQTLQGVQGNQADAERMIEQIKHD